LQRLGKDQHRLTAIAQANVEGRALNRLGAERHFETSDQRDPELRTHHKNEITARAVADRQMECDPLRLGIDQKLLSCRDRARQASACGRR
jgi:hypothetical protein